MSTNVYRKGTKVAWRWGKHTAEGKVTQHFKRRVKRTIDGTEVTRNADDDNPAYLIEQDDGQRVLKSHSELSEAKS